MKSLLILIGILLCGSAFASSQNIDLFSGLTLNANRTSSKAGVMDASGFSAMFHFTGHPKGTMKLQVSNDPNAVVWIDLPSGSQAVTDAADYRFNFDGARDRLVRAVWTHTNQTQISTLTLDGALVADNQLDCTVNGRTYTETYAASSDATWAAMTAQLAADADVDTAAVTVVGGNQTGSDDRVITLTGFNNIPFTAACTVTLGAGQAAVAFATSQNASYGAANVWLQSGYGF